MDRLERRLASSWQERKSESRSAPPRAWLGRTGKIVAVSVLLVGVSSLVHEALRGTGHRATPIVAPTVRAPITTIPSPEPAPAPEITTKVTDLPSVPAVAADTPASPAANTISKTAPKVAAPKITDAKSSGGDTAIVAVASESTDRHEAAPAEPSTESEVGFLRRAQGRLTTAPSDALQMADEHATRFPKGVFVQEREVLAIDALVRLGRKDEARTRARAFQARYPNSAHASRVAALAGD